MKSEPKSDWINSKKLVIWVAWLIPIAFVVFAGVVVLFFLKAYSSEQAVSSEAWGQFGDYVGGILNPVFSFLGFVALVLTLALQSRQLELTKIEVENSRKELEATREQLRKSAVAQEQTAEALSMQAQYAVTSARVEALRASLGVVSEEVSQHQGGAIPTSHLDNYKDAVKRKTDIAQEIQKIANDLMKL